MFDGTSGDGCWWNAVGVRKYFGHQQMPAYNGQTAARVKLFIRTPVDIDCERVPGGSKAIDECGVCGVCDGDNTSCAGCDNVPNSGKVNDECGVCNGDNTSCAGCDGVPNSGKEWDACNVC